MSSPAAPRRNRWHWAAGLAFVLLFWLTVLRFPAAVTDPALDASWGLCLAHFLKTRSQAGSEYVFTYGPLGYFATPVYDADLFTAKLVWEALVGALLAGLMLDLLRRLPGWPLRVGCALSALFLIEPVPDTLYLLAAVLLVVLPLVARRVPAGVQGLAVAALPVFGLVKFTLLLFGTVCWLTVLVVLRRERRRLGEAAAAFPLGLLLAWLLLGQRLSSLPRYLLLSWDVASGYGAAMGADGDDGRLLASLLILLLTMVLTALTWRQAPEARSKGALTVLVLALVLTWKHGFTRQPSHDWLFFNFMLIAPFLWAVFPGQSPSRARLALIAAGVGLAMFYRVFDLDPLRRRTLWRENVAALSDPAALRARCEADRSAAERAWDLPAVRARVGDEPIDQVSCAQGILFLNRLNYRPRPVFQGYTAYTPRLLEANAAFFRGDRAPRFVLCQLEPLGRFPTSDDTLALLEVCRFYRPVLQEKGFLLLERRSDLPPEPRAVLVGERSVAFGEEVPLDDPSAGPLLLVLHVEESLPGRAAHWLLRPPELTLCVRTDAGDTRRYRLVPALAEAGFLLDPPLRTDEDLRRFLCGEALPHVTAFTIETSASGRVCYRQPIRLRLIRRDDLAP